MQWGKASNVWQVRDVSENPLKRKKQRPGPDSASGPLMETRILERAINKICSLLAVGFGDAGAEVCCNTLSHAGYCKG